MIDLALDRPHFKLLAVAGSTNDIARSWIGAPDGAVVVADHQTAGRGRSGRSWYSPPGLNLYLSRVCRVEPLGLLPLAAALGVLEGLALALGPALEPAIKWPNDIQVGGHKLAGILCEVGEDTAGRFGVAGVGVNVNLCEFQGDMRRPPTSLALLLGRTLERAQVLRLVLGGLDRVCALLRDRPDQVVRDYRRACATLGQRVRVELPGRAAFEGVAEDIAPDGALSVLTETGERQRVLCGDVD